MAQIVINEISDNYTFNTGTGAFATVALPITAAWGPAYLDPATVASNVDDMLDDTKWYHFEATQAGLEAFVAAYRGPSSNYKIANDYSYQTAMTLLTAGYDVLVCRVCPGAKASGTKGVGSGNLVATAKYAGSFGNNIQFSLKKLTYKVTGGADASYYNAIIYVVDSATGAMTAVENLSFTFGYNDADIPMLDEIKSNFISFSTTGVITDGDAVSSETTNVTLSGGSDVLPTAVESETISEVTSYYAIVVTKPNDWSESYANYYKKKASHEEGQTAYEACAAATDWVDGGIYIKETTESAADFYYLKAKAQELVNTRFNKQGAQSGYLPVTTSGDYYLGAAYTSTSIDYVTAWGGLTSSAIDNVKLSALAHMEWVYNSAFLVYQLLKDKLNYNPNRIMSAWDDQNVKAINGSVFTAVSDGSGASTGAVVSPLHKIIMYTAFWSRCATGMIDLPKALPRSLVYNTSSATLGYVQRLSEETLPNGEQSNNKPLYNTNSAVFGPWATYRLVSMQKMVSVSPSFIALLIHRAQVLNQAAQYEWILPSNKRHNLKIGEPDYSVSTKLLNIWQKLDGVGVNVVTKIPDLGTNVWGNSTLYNVPPATYQALANLSTRWIFNAIEDVVYRCGIAITFNYNNSQSYSAFYAGVSPLLDTLVNVGAIESYKIKMSADINGLDQVNANSVIGKIWITPVGSISDITVDLIALPQGTDLGAFGS